MRCVQPELPGRSSLMAGERRTQRASDGRGAQAAAARAGENAPKILQVPIGLEATGTRREFDSLGNVDVPANKYWGAQTQRSLEHFNIGNDRMPKEVYHAYGWMRTSRCTSGRRARELSPT
jgi:fumarate hydratase, class II